MVELTLLALSASAEAVSDALIEAAGALSVSVEDADAGTDAEKPLFGEPGTIVPESGWHRSIVRALFTDVDLATQAAARLLAEAGHDELELRAIEPVAEQDWVRLTQSQFTSTQIAPGFWVVPTWHEPPAGAERILRLDPGMAFGTGTHPTTRMCLRWIARRALERRQPWERVLDYGCGSGILSIAAALHGAMTIDAVDIDPDAVAATALNAAANQVDLRAGLPELADGHYELVLANILATPLKLLAPILCSHLVVEGELVLAGILDRQVEEMAATYQPWIMLSATDHEDGWALMTGRVSSIAGTSASRAGA